MAEILGEALELDLGQAAVVVEHADVVHNAENVAHADEVIYNVPEAPELVVPTGDIDANTAARHTHANKSVLDDITAAKVSEWDGKVDKVTGKGLSTNDFSDAEKTKLTGIETGAQVNKIETVNGIAPVSGKNVFIKTKDTYPTLDATQEAAIKNLMDSYYSARTRFHYEYNHGRNAFTDKSKCVTEVTVSGSTVKKYILNCNTFVQMIMMGRSAGDFPANTDNYSPTITKAFSFGYYADFTIRQKIGGLANRDGDTVNSYYGFVAPNKTAGVALNELTNVRVGRDGTVYGNAPSGAQYTSENINSFSKNSYYTGSGNLYGQTFNTFLNANDLAYELYQLGCEIPLSELRPGDIVFTKRQGVYADPVSEFYHSKIFWRGIDHVVMVYGFSSVDGSPVFIECTDYSTPIVRCGLNYSGSSDKLTAARHLMDAVMCARLPIAWGIPSNVPAAITETKNAYELSQEVT